MTTPTEADLAKAREMVDSFTYGPSAWPVFTDEANVVNAFHARTLVAEAIAAGRAEERARVVRRLRALAEVDRGAPPDGRADGFALLHAACDFIEGKPGAWLADAIERGDRDGE